MKKNGSRDIMAEGEKYSSQNFCSFLTSISYELIKYWGSWLNERASIKITFKDVLLFAALYALFGDSIKFIATPRSADLGFYIGDLVTACLFFVELLLSTWTRSVFTYPPLRWQGYFLSVSFFLDVFIIFSLLLPVILSGSDIPFDSTSGVIVRIITLYGRAIVAYKAYLDIVNRFVDAEKIPYQPPTNNRAGGRSGDTLRRGSTASSVPHTDVTAISSNNSVAQRRRSSVGGVEPPDYDRFDSVGYHVRQSKLGSQLTSAITIKVIAIILIMLIILPLTFYEPTDTGPYNYTLWLNNAQANSSIGYDAQNAIYNQYISDMQSQPAFYGFSDVNNTYYLVQLNVTPFVEGFTFDEQSFLNSLRPPVVRRYYISLTNNDTLFYSRAVYNLNPLLRTDALYTIILTVVIIILLVIAISVITSDVQRLVLGPIERMVKMVVAVSKKPLEKQEFDYSQMNEGQFETRLLESTVDKITSLLRVGYGEAGSGIISANLNIDDSNYSSSAVINPLIPGVRVYAIVGFCDIHHFEDVNQRLEKDVLNFVNTIAEIVHSSVQHWGGQCNKNLGNAFVVIWRIGDEGTLLAQTTGISRLGEGASGNLRASPALRRGSGMGNDDDGGTRRRRAGPVTLDIRRVPGVGQLSDRALIAFLKVIAEINRNQRVLIYRSEPRLTSNDTQQFRVRMGFGLHIGWAIEGAVGSLHKVDATYLSPHVNMAARLETSSRQYGVPLLLSQNLHELLSASVSAKCRKLDVVTVKGSEVPIAIYTYDALQEQTFPPNDHILDQYGYQPERSASLFSISNADTAAKGRLAGKRAKPRRGTASSLRNSREPRDGARDRRGGRRPSNLPNDFEGASKPRKRSSIFGIVGGSQGSSYAQSGPVDLFEYIDLDSSLNSLGKYSSNKFKISFVSGSMVANKLYNNFKRREGPSWEKRLDRTNSMSVMRSLLTAEASSRKRLDSNRLQNDADVDADDASRHDGSTQSRPSRRFSSVSKLEDNDDDAQARINNVASRPSRRISNVAKLMENNFEFQPRVEGVSARPSWRFSNAGKLGVDDLEGQPRVEGVSARPSWRFSNAGKLGIDDLEGQPRVETARSRPSHRFSNAFKPVEEEAPKSPTSGSNFNSLAKLAIPSQLGSDSPADIPVPTSSPGRNSHQRTVRVSPIQRRPTASPGRRIMQTLLASGGNETTANSPSANIVPLSDADIAPARKNLTDSEGAEDDGTLSFLRKSFKSRPSRRSIDVEEKVVHKESDSNLDDINLPYQANFSTADSVNGRDGRVGSGGIEKLSGLLVPVEDESETPMIGTDQKRRTSGSTSEKSPYNSRNSPVGLKQFRMSSFSVSKAEEDAKLSPSKSLRTSRNRFSVSDADVEKPTAIRRTVEFAKSLLGSDSRQTIEAAPDDLNMDLTGNTEESRMRKSKARQSILKMVGNMNSGSSIGTLNPTLPSESVGGTFQTLRKSKQLPRFNKEASYSVGHMDSDEAQAAIDLRAMQSQTALLRQSPRNRLDTISGNMVDQDGSMSGVANDSLNTQGPSSPERNRTRFADLEEMKQPRSRRSSSASSGKDQADAHIGAGLQTLSSENNKQSSQIFGSDLDGLNTPADETKARRRRISRLSESATTVTTASTNVNDQFGIDSSSIVDTMVTPEPTASKEINPTARGGRARPAVVRGRGKATASSTTNTEAKSGVLKRIFSDTSIDADTEDEQNVVQKPKSKNKTGSISLLEKENTTMQGDHIDMTGSVIGPTRRPSYMQRIKIVAQFLTARDDPAEVFDQDADLLTLRSHISDEFLNAFSEGINAYLSGDWPRARNLLEESDRLMREAAPALGGDGPSVTLLRYMSQHRWTAPTNWKGFRPLTSK